MHYYEYYTKSHSNKKSRVKIKYSCTRTYCIMRCKFTCTLKWRCAYEARHKSYVYYALYVFIGNSEHWNFPVLCLQYTRNYSIYRIYAGSSLRHFFHLRSRPSMPSWIPYLVSVDKLTLKQRVHNVTCILRGDIWI